MSGGAARSYESRLQKKLLEMYNNPSFEFHRGFNSVTFQQTIQCMIMAGAKVCEMFLDNPKSDKMARFVMNINWSDWRYV